jgi:hypothetical protein
VPHVKKLLAKYLYAVNILRGRGGEEEKKKDQ